MSYQSLPLSMSVVDFWFSAEVQPFWFAKDKDFDDALRNRFGRLYQELSEKFSDDWLDVMDVNDVTLASVITFDQFPRNMFRDTPKAFGADHLALKISKTAIQKGLERKLPTAAHHNFLYMPFMHSENLEDQEEGIRLFSTIPGNEETVSYAWQHRNIIAQFGRFPHRNKILGRTSTPEEMAFLKEFQGF